MHRLLLDSAQRLFTAHGYAAVSTRQIAAEAGVTMPMLFRHFGTKAALFEEAALGPMVEFVSGFTRRWQTLDIERSDPQQVAEDYITGLLDLFTTHRALLAGLSTMLAENGQVDAVDKVVALVTQPLEELTVQADAYAQVLSVDVQQVRSVVRYTVALALGSVLFGEGLFDAMTRAHLGRDMARFVVRGAGYRPPDDV